MTEPTRLVNLTTHEVSILSDSGETVAMVPCSDSVARLRESVEPRPGLDTDHGVIPCARVTYTAQVDGLPIPQPGFGFIVSRVLAAAIRRTDLYFPYPEVRGPDGQIIGAGGLARFAPVDITEVS